MALFGLVVTLVYAVTVSGFNSWCGKFILV